MNTVSTVRCYICGNIFKKENKEINKTLAKGKKHCCSLSCSAKLGGFATSLTKHKVEDLYFLYYYTQCIKKNPKTDITIEYLQELFNSEDGKCPYLNIPLSLRLSKETVSNPVYAASLDRIDSSLPYIRNNVQFISLSINYAKNRYDEKFIFELIDVIQSMEDNLIR